MDRPLRLAHLTTVDMSLALLLAAELEYDVHRGFEVYGISAPGPYVGQIEALGVTHVPVHSFTRAWDPRQDLGAARELVTRLRALDLDVLHTHNPKSGVLGRVLGRLLRVPVIVNTCHGLWAEQGDRWLKRALVYGAEALAAQFSHFELYQNDLDRQTLRRYVSDKRSWTVGNGVDLSRFAPDPEGRARVRAELDLDDKDVLVGGVGRRVAEKGLMEFADAARALAGRATFVWVGPPDEDKPDSMGDEVDGVALLGLRRDMPALYAAFDVFVLPSWREGFSRSAMEAAASGCALVLSDIRGCREIGRDGREVVLVPPHDAAGLAAAILRLVDDPPMRRRLAAAARVRAQKAFDQRRVAELSIASYRRVADRKELDCLRSVASR